MDLDWTLIEYRPGRYAKVATDGTFLGTATEAEIRAWFAASARPSGQEDAPPGPDAGQTPAPAPPEVASPGAHAGHLEPGQVAPAPRQVVPEPEEDWEKPLIWAPPRPARERQTPGPATTTSDPTEDEPTSQPPGREVKASQPEAEVAWAKPMLWAPPRPAREGQVPGPATTTSDPTEDEPTSQPPGHGVKSSQPDAEVAWAKPMLWGRPPADPQRQEGSPEPPSLTSEAQVTTPGAASSKTVRPEPEHAPYQAGQDEAALEGQTPEVAGEPEAEHIAGDRTVATDAGVQKSAIPTIPASSAEPEPVQAQMGFALTEPASPAAQGPAPVQVAMDLAGLDPIAPDSPEPPPEPGPAPDETEPQPPVPEPAERDAGETATDAEDPDEEPDVLAVESDLPEPKPEPAQEDAAILAREPLEAEETGAEPEDLEQVPEIVTVEPDLPEPEAEPGQEDEAALAPPLLDAEETGAEPEDLDEAPDLPQPERAQGEIDKSVIASAAKHRHESSRWQSPRTREKPTALRKGGLLRRSAPRNDMRPALEEVPVPEPLDAEEDWLEAEIPVGETDAAPLLVGETDAAPLLEDETDAASLDTEEDEFAAEPGVLGPPPSLAPGAVPLGAGLDTDEPGPLVEDLDLEAPDAGDLWLWVDPRYEAGYSPATFDLAAFLQRATVLFQSKAWTGGKVPGRIAVHSDDAAQGLAAAAEGLGLVVVEDARVSGGTYWLGLGADGEPEETTNT